MNKIAIENLSLARSIFLQLIKQKQISSVLDFDSKFTEEQLSSIQSLLIEGIDDLRELDKLTNLSSLVIANDFSNTQTNYDINHIKNLEVINNLKSLEKLIILNDFYIEELDITYLKNLRQLVIINNPGLKKIIGIGANEQLQEIIIYGNHNLRVDSSLLSSQKPEKKILDIYLLNEHYFSLQGIDEKKLIQILYLQKK